ncbi:MAG: 30S ribosomal protein S20 [Oligoflexia bacterium]|nr:30S ribosomal protein S20 [Oligoflexia bacterium]
MANVKSAEKRNRQNIKRRARNNAVRTSIRTVVTGAKAAIAKDAKNAGTAVVNATSAMAKAAMRGYIPKKRMARKTSRLQKALNKALS